MARLILAIDPGSHASGWALWNHGVEGEFELVQSGKEDNWILLQRIEEKDFFQEPREYVIEMPELVGQHIWHQIFETCYWVGRFSQACNNTTGQSMARLTRREVKMSLLGKTNIKGADSAIKQVLIGRFARNATNFGKGTKKEPGPFFGLVSDAWQALGLAVAFGEQPVSDVPPF